ncbi:Retrovirus-related Pol polyprotein from transposon 17.6 [Thelohanellus kitauei]|uniref:Retrovirus-related Pol polyprotein from transposon 17.6 n=1 Tax=Thelohanellus kitauei TaxID=669202 RepID=A0A0C2IJE6_THEKT|nr:Retrovirus-related Pol polyprotein from transposon 17.6 [Thelohanellus kitauei]
MKLDPARIQPVLDFHIAKNPHEVKKFLGFASYYSKFIPDFAVTFKPFHWISEKSTPFDFTSIQMKSFQGKVLADASNTAMGLVLEKECRVLCYASRVLKSREIIYYTWTKVFEDSICIEKISSIHIRQYI